jgi:hypothetical protein
MELTRAMPRNGAHLADTDSGAAATMALAERA